MKLIKVEVIEGKTTEKYIFKGQTGIISAIQLILDKYEQKNKPRGRDPCLNFC